MSYYRSIVGSPARHVNVTNLLETDHTLRHSLHYSICDLFIFWPVSGRKVVEKQVLKTAYCPPQNLQQQLWFLVSTFKSWLIVQHGC